RRGPRTEDGAGQSRSCGSCRLEDTRVPGRTADQTWPGPDRRWSGGPLSPDLLCNFHDQPELVGLLLAREHVALHGRGEAALRRETQLLEVDVAGGLVDAAAQKLALLEFATFGGDEPQHHYLSLWHKAQWLEASRASVVPLHEEAVDL